MDYFKLVFGVTFFFAMLGGVIGPMLGYQTLIIQRQECYMHSEYDNTFEYSCAGVGLVIGLLWAASEYRKKKVKQDDAERDQSEN